MRLFLKQASDEKYFAAFGNCICKLFRRITFKSGNLQLGAAGKNHFLRYSFMKLLLNVKMWLAFALSDNRHTSQKYKFIPVFLLGNLKQLTRNSYLEANLVLFSRLSPKGSNLCSVFGEN